jgi:hypothetical protein
MASISMGCVVEKLLTLFSITPAVDYLGHPSKSKKI